MTLALFAVSALALHRVLYLLQYDKITERWRERLFDRWPPTLARAQQYSQWSKKARAVVFLVRPTNRPQNGATRVGQLLSCPWCLGLWLAGPLVLVLCHRYDVPAPLLWWPALSSAAALLNKAA